MKSTSDPGRTQVRAPKRNRLARRKAAVFFNSNPRVHHGAEAFTLTGPGAVAAMQAGIDLTFAASLLRNTALFLLLVALGGHLATSGVRGTSEVIPGVSPVIQATDSRAPDPVAPCGVPALGVLALGSVGSVGAGTRRKANKRAARRERQTAQAVGSQRVHRERGESAPDVHPFEARGIPIIPEVKSRKAPLRTMNRWLAQAWSYTVPGQHAVVVVYGAGESLAQATVTMRWETFAELSGLVKRDAQGVLPLGGAS